VPSLKEQATVSESTLKPKDQSGDQEDTEAVQVRNRNRSQLRPGLTISLALVGPGSLTS
jgi:hypothetical protein